MEKIVFSSDDLPAGFDDRARLSAWRDFVSDVCSPVDVVQCQPDRPFSQRMEAVQFDRVGIMQLCGSTNEMRWTSASRTARSPDFYLCLNRGGAPMSMSQRGTEVECDREVITLGSCTEAGVIRWQGCNNLSLVVIPQTQLRELVTGAEDLLAARLPSSNAAELLRSYLAVLPAPNGIEDGSALAAHIAGTVTDLVALALGTGRDATALAGMRGLRAARLQQVLAQIHSGFADPTFSPRSVAGRLGVSARHVQQLLQETGSSFTERVLELRLQRARAMLADPRNDRLKAAEIAAACGFNEIPYFNRCFRRRFGGTPTQFRGGGAA